MPSIACNCYSKGQGSRKLGGLELNVSDFLGIHCSSPNFQSPFYTSMVAMLHKLHSINILLICKVVAREGLG